MNFKKKLLIVLALILAAGAYYYAALPAINIHSSETWFFVIFLLAALAVIYAVRKKLGRKELGQSKVMKFFGIWRQESCICWVPCSLRPLSMRRNTRSCLR